MMLRHRAETLSEILSTGGQRDISLRSDLFSSSFPAEERTFDCYQSAIPDGLYVPQVIVPRSGDLEDLFATVATYYPDQSPLTALAHVLTPEFAGTVMREQNSQWDNDRERHGRYRRAMIGAALGEAALAALGAQEGSSGPPLTRSYDGHSLSHWRVGINFMGSGCLRSKWLLNGRACGILLDSLTPNQQSKR